MTETYDDIIEDAVGLTVMDNSGLEYYGMPENWANQFPDTINVLSKNGKVGVARNFRVTKAGIMATLTVQKEYAHHKAYLTIRKHTGFEKARIYMGHYLKK